MPVYRYNLFWVIGLPDANSCYLNTQDTPKVQGTHEVQGTHTVQALVMSKWSRPTKTPTMAGPTTKKRKTDSSPALCCLVQQCHNSPGRRGFCLSHWEILRSGSTRQQEVCVNLNSATLAARLIPEQEAWTGVRGTVWCIGRSRRPSFIVKRFDPLWWRARGLRDLAGLLSLPPHHVPRTLLCQCQDGIPVLIQETLILPDDNAQTPEALVPYEQKGIVFEYGHSADGSAVIYDTENLDSPSDSGWGER